MRKRVLPTWQPASIFLLLSLAFGLIIIFANPPLRGPDEIAHFLRIYSYARGELLPITEVNARKGIFVNPGLYNQLYFFKTAGEVFARSREERMRYGQIMADYSKFADSHGDETEQASMFAPFAGTEGHNSVAYIPYIAAAAIGRLLKLDFPARLLLMRLFGLLAFTAVTAYAIAITPVLKWAFLLIAMLPASLYSRTVLSADGAALSYALAITALCFSAAARRSAVRQVWERSLWMTLCALSKQPQIIFVLLELMVYRFKELPRRWRTVAIVVLPGLILSPLWVVAVSADIAVWRLLEERNDSSEQFDPLWKLFYLWEHPYHFPLASMDSFERLGGQAVARTHGHRGLAGYSASALDLSRADCPPPTCATSKAQRCGSCARDGYHRPRCPGVRRPRVSDLFSRLYAHRHRSCLGVQGRYFVIALPPAAIFVAALANRELPRGMPAAIAIAGSIIAGITTVDGVLRTHW
jgi:hypothetical protein